MSVSSAAAVQASQAAAQQQSQADQAASALSGNYQMFLTLLTTQLKNQDPLDPMKSNEFTTQLTQMSSLEQTIQTNKNLEALLSANVFQAANTAVGLIGKQIEAVNGGAALKDGSAKWNINLATDATASVQITDKNGNTVYTTTLDGKAGDQAFNWDGKDNSGNAQDPGTYFCVVTATDSNNQPVTSTVSTTGIVTAVDITSSNPLITVNGSQINYSDVKNVTDPASSS
jgi:flagellar basal-body rod modification protein FlgD